MAEIGSIAAARGVNGVGGAQAPQGPQKPGNARLNDSGWLRFDPEGGPSFADTLKQALGEVSQLQDNAKDAIAAFVRGEPVELHEVMAATEEAGIALEFLIEIRNKITDAYRTVINMQT